MPSKKRLYHEHAKVRQTTHWDMDYLPREALEAYYLETGSQGAPGKPQKISRRQQSRIGLGMVAAGLLLLFAALAAGRYLNG